MIYAAFKMDYGIDLYAEQGRMSWQKFLALFQGLSEKTRMREIMSIRTRKIPQPTQYNAEERNNLMELKRYYALEETGLDNYQGELERLFAFLERGAVDEKN